MTETPRKRRRWFKGCLTAIGVMVLMTVIAWVMLGVLSERSTDALRAKGYPTSLIELQEWYSEPPPGENAADYYLEAGKILEAASFPHYDALPLQGHAELPPVGTPIPDEMRQVIALFIAHEAEAFELIDEGTRFDGARYPLRFATAPGANRFPHLTSIRNTARGQVLRTLYVNGQDDKDALLTEFDKLTRVAASLQEEPILISQLVSLAVTSMSISTAHRILNENEFDREQFAQIDQSLERLLDDDGLLRGFVGERCYSSHLMSTQMRVPIVGEIFRADHLGAIDRFIELAEGGLPQRLDIYEESQHVSRSHMRPLSSSLTPALRDSTRSFYETRATILAARAAIAVQRWRLEGGGLPGNWADFPESIRNGWPIDPFSGEPLRYKDLEEGYVIYSVGSDLEDDGGTLQHGNPGKFRGGDVEDVRFTILN